MYFRFLVAAVLGSCPGDRVDGCHRDSHQLTSAARFMVFVGEVDVRLAHVIVRTHAARVHAHRCSPRPGDDRGPVTLTGGQHDRARRHAPSMATARAARCGKRMTDRPLDGSRASVAPSTRDPAATDGPGRQTHACVRCGGPVPLDVGLCERCNPLGLRTRLRRRSTGRSSSRSCWRSWGSPWSARLALAGVGPFPATVRERRTRRGGAGGHPDRHQRRAAAPARRPAA